MPSCLPLPVAPPLPDLPGGISLEPTIPSFGGDASLCCKILQFGARTPNVPLPPFALNPAALTALNVILDQVQAWLDAQQIPCPKE